MDDAHDGPKTSYDMGSGALDACVLMLYGHILFTSTSYTYALGENNLLLQEPGTYF